jgi:hypothetical protein
MRDNLCEKGENKLPTGDDRVPRSRSIAGKNTRIFEEPADPNENGSGKISGVVNLKTTLTNSV